jgi:hypothetical protein
MDFPNDQPITGFALFADGSLHLQRGYSPQHFQPCCPDQLPANDFKVLVWVIEAALGACHNELQQSEPSSIQSLLRVMALCHANRPCDPITGAVMAWVRPYPIAIDCTEANAKSSGGSLRQSVAGLLPRSAVREGVHPPRVGRLGLVPETGRAAVA